MEQHQHPVLPVNSIFLHLKHLCVQALPEPLSNHLHAGACCQAESLEALTQQLVPVHLSAGHTAVLQPTELEISA